MYLKQILILCKLFGSVVIIAYNCNMIMILYFSFFSGPEPEIVPNDEEEEEEEDEGKREINN